MNTRRKLIRLCDFQDLCVRGRGLALTNGCFDILHSGHADYLEAIKTENQWVVVAVNTDDSVRSLKGNGRPINSEMDRARMVASLQSVDSVVLFDGNLAAVLRIIQPGRWYKGSDYTLETLNPAEVAAANEVGAEIRLIPMTPGYSTTKTIQKLTESP